MSIVEYSNTGDQIWIDLPNIYGGWGLATMFASDGSLYAISSSDMTVYHYNGIPLGLTNNLFDLDSVKIYPNPVTTSTTLELNMKTSKNVEITVRDLLGKAVINIPEQDFQPGLRKINLDFSGLNSGLYFCHIKSDENLQTVKLIKY